MMVDAPSMIQPVWSNPAANWSICVGVVLGQTHATHQFMNLCNYGRHQLVKTCLLFVSRLPRHCPSTATTRNAEKVSIPCVWQRSASSQGPQIVGHAIGFCAPFIYNELDLDYIQQYRVWWKMNKCTYDISKYLSIDYVYIYIFIRYFFKVNWLCSLCVHFCRKKWYTRYTHSIEALCVYVDITVVLFPWKCWGPEVLKYMYQIHNRMTFPFFLRQKICSVRMVHTETNGFGLHH